MNSFAVTFRDNELISVSEVVRNFSKILKSLFTKQREKICILNNNKPQAVIVPMDEYKDLKHKAAVYEEEHEDLYEDVDLVSEIQRRRASHSSVSFDSVLSKAGLN